MPNIEDAFENAVLQVVVSIAYAPKSSPLADINHDQLLYVLSKMTCRRNQAVDIHKNLIFSICNKIAAKPRDIAVHMFSKLLCFLEPPFYDSNYINELRIRVQNLFEDVDKMVIKNLKKFQTKLYSLTMLDTNDEKDSNVDTITGADESVQTANKENESASTVADSEIQISNLGKFLFIYVTSIYEKNYFNKYCWEFVF